MEAVYYNLVTHKSIKIDTLDLNGKVVCIKCKGAKTVYECVYSNSFRGGYARWIERECPLCNGIGFWKEH